MLQSYCRDRVGNSATAGQIHADDTRPDDLFAQRRRIRRRGLAHTDLWWSCGLLTFAVLEHINYYHYQLMYDTRGAFDYVRRNGRLRKAALGLDLRRHNAL